MTKKELFWWKELGECIRTKEIDTSQGVGRYLRLQYYNAMFTNLDFDKSLLKGKDDE